MGNQSGDTGTQAFTDALLLNVDQTLSHLWGIELTPALKTILRVNSERATYPECKIIMEELENHLILDLVSHILNYRGRSMHYVQSSLQNTLSYNFSCKNTPHRRDDIEETKVREEHYEAKEEERTTLPAYFDTLLEVDEDFAFRFAMTESLSEFNAQIPGVPDSSYKFYQGMETKEPEEYHAMHARALREADEEMEARGVMPESLREFILDYPGPDSPRQVARAVTFSPDLSSSSPPHYPVSSSTNLTSTATTTNTVPTVETPDERRRKINASLQKRGL
jgi:hypothetical protein